MKKITVLFLLFCAITSLAFAEGQFEEGRDSNKIIFWHSYTGTEAKLLHGAVEKFERANPDIQIDVLAITKDEIKNKFQREATTIERPNILIGSNDWIKALADTGLIAPIDAYELNLDHYIGTALEALRHNGELYGLPLNLNLVALYYNKSLVPEPAKTLDELIIHGSEGKIVALTSNFYFAFWGVRAFGGQLLNSQDKAVLDQGGFAEWLDWLAENKTNPGMIIDADYDKLYALFKAGKAAYYTDREGVLTDLQNALGKENVGVTTLPAGPEGASAPFLSVEALLFNNMVSENQLRTALEFAEFYASAEIQNGFVKQATYITSNTEVDTSMHPSTAAFMLQAETSMPFNNPEEMAAKWEPAEDAYRKVLQGVMDGREAAIEATRRINNINGR